MYFNSDKTVHQKDLEDEFEIGKSTVTNILKLMEKKGYVVRMVDDADSRHKIISLTQKGEEFHLRTIGLIKEFGEAMEKGITKEERACFFNVMMKIKNNIDNMNKNKEDNND